MTSSQRLDTTDQSPLSPFTARGRSTICQGSGVFWSPLVGFPCIGDDVTTMEVVARKIVRRFRACPTQSRHYPMMPTRFSNITRMAVEQKIVCRIARMRHRSSAPALIPMELWHAWRLQLSSFRCAMSLANSADSGIMLCLSMVLAYSSRLLLFPSNNGLR